MIERVFRKMINFGDSEIYINSRIKMIVNLVFQQKIFLNEIGCDSMVDYIEELKLKGYEEVIR